MQILTGHQTTVSPAFSLSRLVLPGIVFSIQKKNPCRKENRAYDKIGDEKRYRSAKGCSRVFVLLSLLQFLSLPSLFFAQKMCHNKYVILCTGLRYLFRRPFIPGFSRMTKIH